MLNYNTKKIDPRWFLIIILLICSCIITFNNYVNNTYCLTYQIVQCPDNFTLTDYSIEAITDEEANLKIQNLLTEKGFEVCNYNISIKDTNIIIVETGKTEEPETTISLIEKEEIKIEEIVQEPDAGLYSFETLKVNILIDEKPFHNYAMWKTVKSYQELYDAIYERVKIMNDIEYEIIYIKHDQTNTIITEDNFDEIIQSSDVTVSVSVKKAEPEEPTEPETPTEPEEPTNTNLQEVIDNLQEIQKLLYSIIIIINIVLLYMFTRSLFRI